MTKILDLRKKVAKAPQLPQKSREEVVVDKKVVRIVKHSGSVIPQEQAVEKSHMSWEAPSFYYNPQKRHLSLLIAGLLVGAVALLLSEGDTLTSIFLILSSLVLLLYSNQKPTTSKITVDHSGILVDDKMYDYRDLKSFWIEYNPRGTKELSIESARWYLPYIKILLNNQNPVELRSLVINFLPEQEHENSLIDYVGRKLGL